MPVALDFCRDMVNAIYSIASIRGAEDVERLCLETFFYDVNVESLIYFAEQADIVEAFITENSVWDIMSQPAKTSPCECIGEEESGDLLSELRNVASQSAEGSGLPVVFATVDMLFVLDSFSPAGGNFVRHRVDLSGTTAFLVYSPSWGGNTQFDRFVRAFDMFYRWYMLSCDGEDPWHLRTLRRCRASQFRALGRVSTGADVIARIVF